MSHLCLIVAAVVVPCAGECIAGHLRAGMLISLTPTDGLQGWTVSEEHWPRRLTRLSMISASVATAPGSQYVNGTVSCSTVLVTT